MMDTAATEDSRVGPVLDNSGEASAVIAAIGEDNPLAVTIARGSYRRVTARRELRVKRTAIEKHLGKPFLMPADLEKIMPSFSGVLTMDEEGAEWKTG